MIFTVQSILGLQVYKSLQKNAHLKHPSVDAVPLTTTLVIAFRYIIGIYMTWKAGREGI